MPRRPATSVLFPYTTLFRSLNGAMQSLCWKIDIPYEEGARPIVVFNPHSWPVRAGLELESRRVHDGRSEEHTSELQSRFDLVCRLLLEKKKMSIIRLLKAAT